MLTQPSTWPVWLVVFIQSVQVGLQVLRPGFAEETCPAPFVDCGDACQVFTVEERRTVASQLAKDVARKIAAETAYQAAVRGLQEQPGVDRTPVQDEASAPSYSQGESWGFSWYAAGLFVGPVLGACGAWYFALRSVIREARQEDGIQTAAPAGFPGPRRRGSGVLC